MATTGSAASQEIRGILIRDRVVRRRVLLPPRLPVALHSASARKRWARFLRLQRGAAALVCAPHSVLFRVLEPWLFPGAWTSSVPSAEASKTVRWSFPRFTDRTEKIVPSSVLPYSTGMRTLIGERCGLAT